jgi:hypothetical protein
VAKSLTLTQDEENFVKIAVDFEGREETKVSNSAPTYPTFNGVSWDQVTTFTAAGGSTFACRMAEFKIENDLADNRYKLGSRLRIGMGRKAVRKVTGKLQFEFDNVSLYDQFRNFTEGTLSAIWTGGLAGGSTPYSLTIAIQRLIFTGTTPKANGPGPVIIDMPFEALYNGTNDEIQITLQNLVTAIP